VLLNAELKEIKPEEYKELLEGFVDLFFCTSPPSRESLININEVYDAAYSTDENIKYLKDDIDFIYNQGKAVFENDSRKFSEKEIKKVVNYKIKINEVRNDDKKNILFIHNAGYNFSIYFFWCFHKLL